MKNQYTLVYCALLLSTLSLSSFNTYAMHKYNGVFGHQTQPAAQEEQEQCSICLDAMTPGYICRSPAQLICGHKFHPACIATWKKSSYTSTCPLCRGALVVVPSYSTYVAAGAVLIATGALAYKFRKPLQNAYIQTKAKMHAIYRKLLALGRFKNQNNTTEVHK